MKPGSTGLSCLAWGGREPFLRRVFGIASIPFREPLKRSFDLVRSFVVTDESDSSIARAKSGEDELASSLLTVLFYGSLN